MDRGRFSNGRSGRVGRKKMRREIALSDVIPVASFSREANLKTLPGMPKTFRCQISFSVSGILECLSDTANLCFEMRHIWQTASPA